MTSPSAKEEHRLSPFIFKRFFSFDRVAGLPIILVFGFFIITPLALVVFRSFVTTEGQFTVGYAEEVFSRYQYAQSFLNLFIISVGGTIFATVFGSLQAWVIARTNVPHRETLEYLIMIPLFVSTYACAIAWYVLLSPSGILNNIWKLALNVENPFFNILSPWGIIWVLGLSSTPYVYIYTVSTLRNMDPSLEESSQILGASTLQTIRKITLPLVFPGIVSAALLVFVLVATDFAVPGLLGLPKGFVPTCVMIWFVVADYPPRYGIASVLSVLLLLISFAGLYPYRRLVSAQSRFVTVTGKGFRPRMIDLGRWKYLAVAFCLVYVVLAFVLPYCALTIGAFMKYLTPRLSWDLFTLENLYRITGMEIVGVAIQNSLLLAISAATLCVGVGVLICYMLTRTRVAGRGVVDYLVMIPIAIPGIVIGLGFLWQYTTMLTFMYATIWILLLAIFIRHVPYAVRSISPTLIQIHKELEECSRVLGASTFRTITKITVPLLKPALIATWSLVFILAIREMSSIILLYRSSTTTVSVLMWDWMTSGEYTTSCMLALIQTLMIASVMTISQKIFKVKITAAQM